MTAQHSKYEHMDNYFPTTEQQCNNDGLSIFKDRQEQTTCDIQKMSEHTGYSNSKSIFQIKTYMLGWNKTFERTSNYDFQRHIYISNRDRHIRYSNDSTTFQIWTHGQLVSKNRTTLQTRKDGPLILNDRQEQTACDIPKMSEQTGYSNSKLIFQMWTYMLGRDENIRKNIHTRVSHDKSTLQTWSNWHGSSNNRTTFEIWTNRQWFFQNKRALKTRTNRVWCSNDRTTNQIWTYYEFPMTGQHFKQ